MQSQASGRAGKYKFVVNKGWGPGPVNTNLVPGLVSTRWGPGTVNTNWGPGLGAGGQAKGQGPGNTNTLLHVIVERHQIRYVDNYATCCTLFAYNNIEHLWSPLSNSLTGFIHPAVLLVEDQAPCHQNITQAEKKAKEVGLFDNNINELVHKFENFTFDSYISSTRDSNSL